jgi:hypothetical protein
MHGPNLRRPQLRNINKDLFSKHKLKALINYQRLKNKT